MNYEGSDKWEQEELRLNYALGCKYVVSADISTFFPSVYTHSISWAIKDKEWAKKHQCNMNKKKKKKGVQCKFNQNQSCLYDDNSLWPNNLDLVSRSMKDGETNGLLIGPHTSNIVSEIILSKVDYILQEAGFTKVIRHIDDYEFFAKDELEANNFLRILTVALKDFELSLNAKKTKIIPYQEYISTDWVSQLSQFIFPDKKEIGFTSINSYIDYSITLSREYNNFAVLNYAIKVVAGKKLSNRAERLYIKKMCQIAIQHPYILPLLEKYVFKFADKDFSFMHDFLNLFLLRAIENGSTDSIAYIFYYALKYEIKLEYLKGTDFGETIKEIINLNDCISMLIAYKYCQAHSLPLDVFRNKADEVMKYSERDQDKFWLYLYEVLPKSKLPKFLKKLKEANVSFCEGI